GRGAVATRPLGQADAEPGSAGPDWATPARLARGPSTAPRGRADFRSALALRLPVQRHQPQREQPVPEPLWFGHPTGVVERAHTPFCGDGGPATAAQLNLPVGLAVDKAGDVLILDQENNDVREVVAATGIITTVPGTGTAG